MNKLSFSTVVTAVALTLAAPAQAKESEFTAKVGVDAWFPNAKVGTKSNAVRQNDVTESQSFFIALEHTVPYIPDIKVRYTPVKSDRFKYDQIDYTGYYKLLNSDSMQFDLGMTLTQFANGEFNKNGLINPAQPHNQDFSKTATNIYMSAVIRVPTTNFHIFGQYDFGNDDGTRTLDGEAGVKYILPTSAMDIEFKAGYRVMDHEFGYFEGFNSNQANVMVEGWFAGLLLSI